MPSLIPKGDLVEFEKMHYNLPVDGMCDSVTNQLICMIDLLLARLFSHHRHVNLYIINKIIN